VGSEPGELPARFHRAFNDRDFDAWREVFHEDVELVVDGMTFTGVEAALAYGAGVSGGGASAMAAGSSMSEVSPRAHALRIRHWPVMASKAGVSHGDVDSPGARRRVCHIRSPR